MRTDVGWIVDKAYELSQKYKEGKYILEKALTSTSLHSEQSMERD